MAIVVAARPDARLVLAGGQPEQIAARAQARAAGIEARRRVHRPAAGRRDSRLSRRRRRARVAAQHRHEHAAEDLSVPAVRPPIVATRLLTHTQVLDDQVAILTGATPEGFARRHPRRARRSRRGRGDRRRARRACRDQVQLRRLPRTHARGCAHLVRYRARRRSVAGGRGVRRAHRAARSLQLHRLRRSRAWLKLRRSCASAGRSAALLAEAQERACCSTFLGIARRPHGARRGHGYRPRRAGARARAAARVTGDRCLDRDAGMWPASARRSSAGVRFVSRWATRTHFVSRIAAFDAVGLPARADAHARLAPVSSASCAASAGSASCSITRRARAPRRCRRLAPAVAARSARTSRRIGSSRIAQIPAQLHATASGSSPSTGSSCCRLPLHKRIGSRAVHRAASRRLSPPRVCSALLGSPVTVVAERCDVLVTGATGFTGGHLARTLAARGHSVAALVRDAGAAPTALRSRASRSACRRSDGPALARIARSRASTSSITSPPSTGRPACRRPSTGAVNALAVGDADRRPRRPRRAARRSLQHGRRARRDRASARRRRRAASPRATSIRTRRSKGSRLGARARARGPGSS